VRRYATLAVTAVIAADDLNDPQLEAVAHVTGPLLVFAGAGSGKTRVITYRIANLVLTHRVPPYRVLAVTFTNKAAQEMRHRLDDLVGHDLAKDLWVGTFHATCARLIRRHYEALHLTRDFAIYDDADQRSVVNRIVKEKKIDDKRYPPRQLLSAIHKHKQEGHTPEDVERNDYFADVVADVFEAYESALRSCNACDFDDLLLHVLRLVELPTPGEGAFPGDDPAPDDVRHRAGATIRSQFRYVLVDEFQDTNSVQYRLVRALVRDHEGGGNLAVVGDDDQSIYRWRGADVRNIRGFSEDFPSARVVRLEQNYRSTARIVRSALGVISPSRQRVAKELWTANEDGEHVEVRAAVDERDEASQAVSLIDARLREGWTRKEIAILYRTHAQSRVLEEALRQGRIPYRIVGGLRFFERAEIKDLLAYLRLTANPRSDIDLVRVINTPARGIGNTTVDRVIAIAEREHLTLLDAVRCVVSGTVESGDIAAAARKRLSTFLDIVDDLADDAVRAKPPSEIALRAIERSGYRQLLEDDGSTEAATRLQNLGELVGSIRDYEEAARAAGNAPSISGFLEQTALVTAGDEKTTGGAGDDVVTLMTVHAAKGLEFRGVIITGLEDELFPFKGYKALEYSDDDRPSMLELDAEEEDLEEERRLAYVAITRAREKLTLFHAAQRTVFGQTRYGRPSRFLKDLPQEDVKQHASPRRDVFPRSGWGSAPTNVSTGPRSPFRHPQATSSAPPPARAPGERYVEMDDAPSYDADDVVGPRRGGMVRHKKFGRGKVIEVVEEGTEPKVVADFPGWGRMTVLQRFLERD
jgi:DNA helicase II / ATP-dependent DNA helicase PcrA